MSELGKIILSFVWQFQFYLLFCSIFGANIGGSFDRSEYKLFTTAFLWDKHQK